VFDKEKVIQYVYKLRKDATYNSGGVWGVRPVMVLWQED